MADIIERSLNLGVGADDLASATILGLGDTIEELQARATTSFEAIASAGEDAASSLASSALGRAERLMCQADAALAEIDVEQAFAELEERPAVSEQRGAAEDTGRANGRPARR